MKDTVSAKRSMQANINAKALLCYEEAVKYLTGLEFSACAGAYPLFSTIRLRSCNATVIITDEYYILKSYSTIVAVVDKKMHYEVDVLRYVYGYTATSAQHISKFFQDYGYYDANKLTYRPI